jgi:ribosomal protein S12
MDKAMKTVPLNACPQRQEFVHVLAILVPNSAIRKVARKINEWI